VADGTVYARFVYSCCRFSFVTGGFATWDAATGEQGFLGGFEPGSSVTVAGGLVYQAGPIQLGAFDAEGVQNCRDATPPGARICDPVRSGAIGSNGTPDSSPAVANGVVYVGSDDNKLYAFDADGCGAATCPPLWSTSAASGDIDSSPAVANGVVYVGSDDDNLHAFDSDGCGAATCTPLRTLTTGGDVNPSPALGNKMVYVGSDDGRLYAFGLSS
jgi:outer membrane protein assembly factor BamB